MSGDEVFEHAQTFAEVRGNWTLDNLTGRLGHEAAHTAELLDLRSITTGTGGHHDVERIVLLLAVVELDRAIQFVSDLFTNLGPYVDDLLIAFAVGDDTIAILLLDHFDFPISGFERGFLRIRNHHVGNTDRDARAGCLAETKLLETVKGSNGFLLTDSLIAAPDDVSDLLLPYVHIDEAEVLRPDFIEANTTDSSLDHGLGRVAEDTAFGAIVGIAKEDLLIGLQTTFGETEFDLSGVVEHRQVQALRIALTDLTEIGKEERAERNVLRWRGDGLAAGRREDVVRSQHE